MLAVVILFALLSLLGISWGVPSRERDTFLWHDAQPLTGEELARMTDASMRFSPTTGADVDVDATGPSTSPVQLADTDADVAAIYLRYRLYTYQPDEMITMQALAGMRPRELRFDPRLYQYGGLFIYPIGAMLKAGSLVGWIQLSADVSYYLDNPDSFGRFYVVARGYAAFWGLIGVLVVWGIAARLGPNLPLFPLLAALLFTLLPVTICMAHEGKPHLPGAVLMLLAIFLALCATDDRSSPGRRFGYLLMTGAACGAAQGMVLSSLPIFILVPMVAWNAAHRSGTNAGWTVWLRWSVLGVIAGGLVYVVTNPYVPWNLLFNRDVLKSNFGNSLAMYEVDRIGEGLLRVIDLTLEGSGWPVALCGLIGLGICLVEVRRRTYSAIHWGCLVVPGVVFLSQFVLIGAGKPAEYGRFGIFQDTVLALAAAFFLSILIRKSRLLGVPAVLVTISLTAGFGWVYLDGFRLDARNEGSRAQAAKFLRSEIDHDRPLLVSAEPAPYCMPPIDFRSRTLIKMPVDAIRAYGVDDMETAGKQYDAGSRKKTTVDVPQNAVWVVPRDVPSVRPLAGEIGDVDRTVFPHPHRQEENARRPAWRRRLVPGGLPARISWANKPIVILSRGTTAATTQPD